jgi:hypothetical protein
MEVNRYPVKEQKRVDILALGLYVPRSHFGANLRHVRQGWHQVHRQSDQNEDHFPHS